MKIVVKKEDELLNYLVNNIDISRKKLKSYLAHGSIYVNNTSTTKYNYKVYNNDIITINKDHNNYSFNIIFEDNDIIVVDKPSGLLTISTLKEKEKTLYHMLSEYVKSKNRNNKIFIVHRLDKDTSGVLLFAKNEKIKNKLQNNWNEYVKLREYICCVHGKLHKKSGRIVNYLYENKENVSLTNKSNGVEAITNYKVIEEYDDYSKVLVNIETGKRNQIRLAFKSIGHPIIGDRKYGMKDNSSRLLLHASKLKIYYPIVNKEVLFESKIPREIKVVSYDITRKN